MKSAHRHQLETNELAHRLEVYIARYRPYAMRVVAVVMAIAVLILVWTLISNSSSAKRSEAWDKYNQAVSSNPPNLDEIHSTAQDHPGTPIQYLADVTWADGQVWMASRNYLNFRQMAMDSLDRASSAYQGVIQASKDERLTSRAHLGLARIYEMQNHLDKARAEYRAVTGSYADFAKREADRLDEPDSQATYAWLATAQPPRPKPPVGPGTPGQTPAFSPGDLGLPGAPGAGAGKTDEMRGGSDAFESLFKGPLQPPKAGETADRYKSEQSPKDTSPMPPGGTSTAPELKGAAPPPSAATPPEAEKKDGNKPSETPPKTDTPTK